MKKILVMGFFLTLSMNAYAAAPEKSCPDVGTVKNTLNNDLSDLKRSLARRLNIPVQSASRSIYVGNIESDIQNLRVSTKNTNTSMECQYKMGDQVVLKIQLPK